MEFHVVLRKLNSKLSYVYNVMQFVMFNIHVSMSGLMVVLHTVELHVVLRLCVNIKH